MCRYYNDTIGNEERIPADIDFDTNWFKYNTQDYEMFTKLHRLAHSKFYCHVELYPVPKMIVTYKQLVTDPQRTFAEMMKFVGYEDANVEANVESALEKYPPKISSQYGANGTMEYIPINGPNVNAKGEDKCKSLRKEFRLLYRRASPCVQKVAKLLHFTK